MPDSQRQGAFARGSFAALGEEDEPVISCCVRASVGGIANAAECCWFASAYVETRTFGGLRLGPSRCDNGSRFMRGSGCADVAGSILSRDNLAKDEGNVELSVYG